MHPVLLRLGSLELPSYGASIAAGFVIAVLLAVRGAERQGISVNRVLDLSLWMFFAAVLGARLLFVLANQDSFLRQCLGPPAAGARTWSQIALDCSRPLQLWEGGFVFFGGLFAALLVFLWYTQRHALPFFKLADLALPLIALGHFFGRLGCFLAGCCYGRPTTSPLGVAFPPSSLAFLEMRQRDLLPPEATATMPLHPTQLYEALVALGIFALLLLIGRRRRYYGQVLVSYLVLYPIARFFIELLRADAERGVIWRLSTSQLLSLASLFAALILQRVLRQRTRSAA